MAPWSTGVFVDMLAGGKEQGEDIGGNKFG